MEKPEKVGFLFYNPLNKGGKKMGTKKQRKSIKMLAILMAFFAMAVFMPSLTKAGDLEPSGPPGSTMYTLDEIYDIVQDTNSKVSWNCGGGAVVEKSGQTISYEDYDDGYYEKGVAWPSPRFTNNGDGTVTDNLTKLIWLKDAHCFGQRNWSEALSDCHGLASGPCGLTDGSNAGDWRLPNVKELQSLIDFSITAPALPSGHPFDNVSSTYYWSSTTAANGTGYACHVDMGYGNVYNHGKSVNNYVWPV